MPSRIFAKTRQAPGQLPPRTTDRSWRRAAFLLRVGEPIPACAAFVHSSRSSIIGSIESARCAGIQVANSPSKAIARTTPANTSGSRGVA